MKRRHIPGERASIQCCECLNEFQADVVLDKEKVLLVELASHVRRLAANKGWTVTDGGLDLCPNHKGGS